MKKHLLILLALLVPIAAWAASGVGKIPMTMLECTHTTTPSNPASGKARVYCKNDGKIYTLSSAGTEEQLQAGSSGTVAVSVKTADYTLTNSDDVLLFNCTTECTLSLHAVASATIKPYRVKNIGVGNLILDANGTETFERSDLTVELPPGGLPSSGFTIIPDTGGSSWSIF